MNPTTRIEQAGTGFMTAAQLDRIVSEHGDLRHGDRWGRWIYDAEHLVLSAPVYGPNNPYEIDLERCCSDADAWGWVSHLAMKTWATDADVGAVARALRAWLGRLA